MAVKAKDQVTLAVVASLTQVRLYYLKQSSSLGPPAKPTANPPTGWSLTEPTYTSGSTDTLYTVIQTLYGASTFAYGDVQKASSFEAAKQAFNKALGAIASTRIEYAVNASATVPPPTNSPLWSTATPNRQTSQYIWFRTVNTNGAGEEYVSSPALVTGDKGDDSKLINISATTQILTSPAAGGATTPATSVVTGTATNTTINLWQYSSNGGTFSGTLPAGVTRSGNVVTITGSTMAANTITVKMGDSSGTEDVFTVAKVKESKGVSGTAITYQSGTSATTAPTGAWVANPPAIAENNFLWTRIITTYTDNTTSTAYSVAKQGEKGDKGDRGLQGIQGDKGDDGIAGKDGVGIKSTTITYAQSTSGTSAPTTGWSTNPPSATAGSYIWTRTVWTYDDNTTETGYSVGKIGDTGATGSKGDTGEQGVQGVSVTSITPYYRKLASSASAPAIPTTMTPSGWEAAEPAWDKDYALYRTERVVLSNGSFQYTPVSKVEAWSAADKVQEDLDNLRIGGRNYFRNSAGPFTTTTSYLAEFLVLTFNMSPVFDKYGIDREYTISFDLSSKDPSVSSTISSYPYPASPPVNKYLFPRLSWTGITTEPQRKAFTFKPMVGDLTKPTTRIIFYGTYDTGNVPIVENIKLELGNKATDWSPAPEDVDSEIETVKDSALYNSRVEYAVNTSETVAPTSDWSVSQPTRTPGSFIWVRTVITYGSGNTSTTAPALLTGNTGAKGDKGDPGENAKLVNITATSQVLISPAAGGATSPTTSVVTGVATNTTISVWQYSTNGGSFSATLPTGVTRSGNAVTVTGSTMTANTITVKMGDSSGTEDVFTVAKVKDGATGAKGDTGSTGAAGKGVTGAVVTYQGSTSATTTPTGTWSSTVPTVAEGSYLWTRTITTYTDSSTTTAYSVAKQGARGAQGNTGATGSAGKGVSTSVVTYQSGDSGTATPTGTWSSEVPTVAEGKFLWTRTIITYTDSATTTTYSVAKQGEKGSTGSTGASGLDAYTVLLSNESHVFPAGITNAVAGSITSSVIAYKGATQVAATIGTITGQVTGLTTPAHSNNGTTTAAFTVTAETTLKTRSGVLTVPITVDGKSFTRTFSWSLANQGDTGADAYTVLLTNEAHVFPAGPTNAVAGNTTVGVIAYKGGTRVNATIGTVSGMVTGLTVGAVSGNGGQSPSVTVTAATSLATRNGNLTFPITVDGKSFTRTFSWSLANQGATGAGAQAITPYYQTVLQGGSVPATPTIKAPAGWSTQEPGYTAGYELYRTERVDFSDGAFFWSPVTKVSSYQAATDAMERADEAYYIGNAAQEIAEGAVIIQPKDWYEPSEPEHALNRLWIETSFDTAAKTLLPSREIPNTNTGGWGWNATASKTLVRDTGGTLLTYTASIAAGSVLSSNNSLNNGSISTIKDQVYYGRFCIENLGTATVSVKLRLLNGTVELTTKTVSLLANQRIDEVMIYTATASATIRWDVSTTATSPAQTKLFFADGCGVYDTQPKYEVEQIVGMWQSDGDALWMKYALLTSVLIVAGKDGMTIIDGDGMTIGHIEAESINGKVIIGKTIGTEHIIVGSIKSSLVPEGDPLYNAAQLTEYVSIGTDMIRIVSAIGESVDTAMELTSSELRFLAKGAKAAYISGTDSQMYIQHAYIEKDLQIGRHGIQSIPTGGGTEVLCFTYN